MSDSSDPTIDHSPQERSRIDGNDPHTSRDTGGPSPDWNYTTTDQDGDRILSVKCPKCGTVVDQRER
ncbi:hypothetical protein SAMN05216388_10633 [Halorientalis persicus]|uniref:Uncharacterized protein n=1 Tax=Halorientalis persicus TaxID=1367881 RepID=A0A1H8WKM2_9EURY|nr:hypothetical protein [Halorientalis persicus]SEP28195.1 hypothetical protein SAMN05216388_10633 [Halorientalis persicus]